MDIENIKLFYQKRIDSGKCSLASLKRKIHIVGTIRLAIVIAAGILIYLLWHNTIATCLVVLCFLILFLWLIHVHSRLFEKKVYQETSIQSDENEIKAINYNFSAFDGAEDRIKMDHPFSLDLDIFGNKSVFRMINRTCTVYGKEVLANWIENLLTDKSAIQKRQEAVGELSEKKDLTHHFIVSGLINPGNRSDLEEIKKFMEYSPEIGNTRLWKTISRLIPIIWAAIILLLYLKIIPAPFIGLIIIFFIGFGECKIKKINRLQNMVGRKMKVFSGYAVLMQIIEGEKHNASFLEQIRSRFIANGKSASLKIKHLSKLMGDLDIRFNVPARIVLNSIFLWDIKKAIAIEQWQKENAAYLSDWIKALGEYDATCSMAVFKHTHPGYIFPEITDQYFEMKGTNLGHPLIHRDQCVKNDVEIPFKPYFMIVTGANMAGKSTYLRTIGINYIFACMGLPVFADTLSVFPAQLVTSLRTTDSLSDNESYFFAELKRLKMIIDELHAGKKLFIILDEILKGTNSVDKQKGSLALVEQLVSLDACGVIATHDLLLGNLEKEFPGQIKNMRFEADITNDELYFSYKIKTGIAQNMNACFLMKKMGITV